MFLAAIRPPNNAETALMEMKHRLYSETGAVSAWALKPLIPLAFFSGELPGIERKHLPCIPPDGIRVDETVLIGNQFCLSSAGCMDFCGNISGLFKSQSDFNVGFRGVHLFDSIEMDEASTERVIKLSMKLTEGFPESVLNWRSGSFEIYKTEPGLLSGEGWWKRVILETVLELNFPAARLH